MVPGGVSVAITVIFDYSGCTLNPFEHYANGAKSGTLGLCGNTAKVDDNQSYSTLPSMFPVSTQFKFPLFFHCFFGPIYIFPFSVDLSNFSFYVLFLSQMPNVNMSP